MRLVCLVISIISGCSSNKPVEWYPRITAWKNNVACADPNVDNSARISIKEPELCRTGSGVLIKIGRTL